MTKGAEGTVAGWQASIGKQGKPMLDTLFVKLTNPPKLVQIEGLPLNVVPITRCSTKTVCKLWNDDVITISRNQVLVLPNFSMTDYSAQGLTRPDNVVELNNCKTHQSYYTCLSRSATADGTIILQGFDSSKITGGAPGYLRQEFRELEILDYISKMRYQGTLLINIDGHRRNTLILQFQSWKGANYVPEEVHPSIQWSAAHPFIMQERNDVSWHIPKNVKVDKVGIEKVNHFNTRITAKGSIPIYQIQEESNVGKKHKLEELAGVVSKKQKQSNEGMAGATLKKQPIFNPSEVDNNNSLVAKGVDAERLGGVFIFADRLPVITGAAVQKPSAQSQGCRGERKNHIIKHRRRAAQIEQVDAVALGNLEKHSARTAEPSEMIQADAAKFGKGDRQQGKVNAGDAVAKGEGADRGTQHDAQRNRKP